jgi:hypothetical protein
LAATPQRFLVPYDVLGEILDGAEHYAVRAAMALRDLARMLGPRLRVTFHFAATLDHELRQSIDGPTLHETDEVDSVVAAVVEKHRGTRESLVNGTREAKASSARFDAGLRDELIDSREKHKLTEAQVVAQLASLQIADIPEVLVREAVLIAPARRPDIPTLMRTLRDHPVLLSFCTLYLLAFLGRMSADLQHQAVHPLRPHRNDWYDASIAASAAYADYFVVEDQPFRDRCALARAKGFLEFKAVTVREVCGLAGSPR